MKEQESAFKEIYLNWSKNLMNINLSIIVFSILAETVMLVMYIITNNLDMPIDTYILRYMITPAIINISLYLIGNLILKNTKINASTRMIVPVIVINYYCLTLSIIHDVFIVLILLYIIPIVLTIIYSNKKLTKAIYFLTITNIIIRLAFTSFDFVNGDLFETEYYFSYVLAFIILTVTYHIVKLLLKYESEKDIILLSTMEKNNQLQTRLYHDGLTGLYNHTALFNMLDEAIEKKTKNLSLAVIDIDLFKLVNDEFGHTNGNVVLIRLSKILKRSLPAKCYATRYGGEEFAIIFKGYDSKQSYKIINEIRKQFGNYKFKELNNKQIHFSGGVYTHQKGENASTLFERADEALYISKNNGRNKITIYK